MAIALTVALATIWLLLWGVFHLAGGPFQLVLVAMFLLLAWRVCRSSNVRMN